MGLTFLETIANPYTTVLGSPQYAAVRINIAQTFNGVGWILGPIIGGMFFYSDKSLEEAHQSLWIPYAGVAAAVLVLAVVFFFAKIPDIQPAETVHTDEDNARAARPLWSNRHFAGAVVAQFVYVAAQAGIFSFFINYIVAEVPSVGESLSSSWMFGGQRGVEIRDGGWFVNESGATKLLAYFGFFLFLLGRFTGSGLLSRVAAHKALGTYAAINAVLMLLITLKLGWISVFSVFLSFFFMSIMFPTIFALGIHGLGAKTKLASSFIVMAIMGGAIMPKLMGWLGDTYNMSVGFAMPAGCFLVVAIYGFIWPRLSGSPGLVGVKTQGGH